MPLATLATHNVTSMPSGCLLVRLIVPRGSGTGGSIPDVGMSFCVFCRSDVDVAATERRIPFSATGAVAVAVTASATGGITLNSSGILITVLVDVTVSVLLIYHCVAVGTITVSVSVAVTVTVTVTALATELIHILVVTTAVTVTIGGLAVTVHGTHCAIQRGVHADGIFLCIVSPGIVSPRSVGP